MKKALLLASCLLLSAPGVSQETPRAPATHKNNVDSDKESALHTSSPNKGVLFQPTSVSSVGSVDVEGRRIVKTPDCMVKQDVGVFEEP